MSKREALELRALISVEAQHLQVRVQKIGNGEYVVVVAGFFWLWLVSDWTANKEYLLSLKTNIAGAPVIPRLVG